MSETKGRPQMDGKSVNYELIDVLRHLLLIFGGTKGGIFKSGTTLSIRDFLICLGAIPIVVDTDPNNPDLDDAIKASEGNNLSVPIDLANQRGIRAFCDVMTKALQHPILVSRPGGDAPEFVANAPVIEAVAASLGRRPIFVWSIDTGADAFRHLEDISTAMSGFEFWVSRPEFFGKPDDFEAFNTSVVGRKCIEANRVIDFPRLPDFVYDGFKATKSQVAEGLAKQEQPTKRLTPKALYENGSVFDRATIELWRAKVKRALQPLNLGGDHEHA